MFGVQASAKSDIQPRQCNDVRVHRVIPSISTSPSSSCARWLCVGPASGPIIALNRGGVLGHENFSKLSLDLYTKSPMSATVTFCDTTRARK